MEMKKTKYDGVTELTDYQKQNKKHTYQLFISRKNRAVV